MNKELERLVNAAPYLRSVHGLVSSALKRDAEKGLAVRAEIEAEFSGIIGEVLSAIEALYAAQAQSAQAEPFRYYREVHKGWPEYNTIDSFSDGRGGGIPLYTAQQQEPEPT